MNIRTYKRYFQGEFSNKTIVPITDAADATAVDIDDLVKDIEQYTRTCFRKMHLSFVVEDSNDATLADDYDYYDCYFDGYDDYDGYYGELRDDAGYLIYSVTDNGYPDYRSSQKYVNILTGEYPEWQVVGIDIHPKFIRFLLVIFNDDGTILSDSFEFVYLDNLHIGTSLKVEIDDADGAETDTYLIFECEKTNSVDLTYVVEEYKGSNLLRSCTICFDIGGEFELVKESN